MEHLINWKKTIASKYCVVFHNSFLGRKLKNAFLKSERLNITSKLNLSFHFKIVNATVLLFKNPVQRNSMTRSTWSGHTSQDNTCPVVLGIQRLLPVVSFSYKITLRSSGWWWCPLLSFWIPTVVAEVRFIHLVDT